MFIPKDDGGLDRYAVGTIEAGNNVAGRGIEAEGVHG
jgi:hypothetical protein